MQQYETWEKKWATRPEEIKEEIEYKQAEREWKSEKKEVQHQRDATKSGEDMEAEREEAEGENTKQRVFHLHEYWKIVLITMLLLLFSNWVI